MGCLAPLGPGDGWHLEPRVARGVTIVAALRGAFLFRGESRWGKSSVDHKDPEEEVPENLDPGYRPASLAGRQEVRGTFALPESASAYPSQDTCRQQRTGASGKAPVACIQRLFAEGRPGNPDLTSGTLLPIPLISPLVEMPLCNPSAAKSARPAGCAAGSTHSVRIFTGLRVWRTQNWPVLSDPSRSRHASIPHAREKCRLLLGQASTAPRKETVF